MPVTGIVRRRWLLLVEIFSMYDRQPRVDQLARKRWGSGRLALVDRADERWVVATTATAVLRRMFARTLRTNSVQ